MRKSQYGRKTTNLSYLAHFMSGLHANQDKLRTIQSAYDNLTLLGQLLCAGTDITGMRDDFSALAQTLLDQLAHELHKKTVLSLDSNARVAIDILIRNLFERTADIGFLATDMEVRRFAEAVEKHPGAALDTARISALRSHFAEYVRKYSVYHNIILLSPQGKVLAQLDSDNPVRQSNDPLIAEALATEQAYVETFRASDLLPREETPLLYSYRVMSEDGSHPVGVLCLCFRFQDECRRIFENLVAEDDWTVITLLAPDGKIIASSDIYQFPLGARLECVGFEECAVVRFAGREYLATTRQTSGYQGYFGPGWLGHALAPLNHAFEMAEAHELERVAGELLDCVLETATLFTPELRDIPLQAARIQSELNRAVWNGNIWLSRDQHALNTSFAKVLLWEIGSTGVKTRSVFSESTTNLYKTVVSSVLYDCGTQAALAIDIMDRNLYERANDCRWWALTRAFREGLAQIDIEDRDQRQRLTDILRTINGLYTVYSNLLIFDTSAQVLAVSNPAYNDLVGHPMPADWVRQTLGLADTQSYCVSSFSPSELYAQAPTYIYSAAIRAPEAGADPVGGIAIVFDSTPQFEAMLRDALPRQSNGNVLPGAFAVFSERDGRVIASTDPHVQAGDLIDLPSEYFAMEQGESRTGIVTYRGRYYAVGSCISAGYREYKSENDCYHNDLAALVLTPLSDSTINPNELLARRPPTSKAYALRQQAGSEESVEIATFMIGSGWYGIASRYVFEAIDPPERITPIPGMPEWVCGCIMHQGQATTVLDLAAFMNGKRVEAHGRQIVVLHSAEEQLRFGIFVDELGEIPEIPASRIEPVPSMMVGGNSVSEALVKPRRQVDEDDRILVILSPERLFHRLGASPRTGQYLPSRQLPANV